MHPLLWLGYEIEIVDRDFSRLDSTVRNYALSEFLLLLYMNSARIFARTCYVYRNPLFCIHTMCYVYRFPSILYISRRLFLFRYSFCGVLTNF